MEIKIIENKIELMCLKAKNFPETIMDAFKDLSNICNFKSPREIYGISRANNNGKIDYYAAYSMIDFLENEKYNLEKITLKSGKYYYIEICDYMSNISKIGDFFQKTICLNDIDMNGFCVEKYSGNNVECMVRISD